MNFRQPNHSFSFAARMVSMQCAGRGVLLTLRSQHNMWIHAAATVVVIVTSLYFGITVVEWCLLVLACAAVWTAETMNTAFESLADATTQESHPIVGRAKDMAAGAVLITALGAVIIGVVIFGPYVLHLFR